MGQAEEWPRVRELLEAALELPPEERVRFVEERETDATLRQEAVRLLRDLETTSHFLETHPALVARSVLDEIDAGPRLTAGAMLGGRFRIRRFIGRGGMGEVYAANDVQSGADVAVKVIRSPSVPNPQMLSWLKDELILARAVTHGNVCRVFDLHTHAGSEDAPEMLFLTMELLEGETLAQRLERRGVLDRDQGMDLARQLAAGLANAHEAGVVHGDLKPSNIMLVPQGAVFRAVIMDFGIAAATELQGGPGPRAPIGTPAYMAPDQRYGAPTSSSDVYSFGVVVYEALSGRRPQSAESAAVLRRSAQLEAVIRRCLRADPSKRFRSGGELADALRVGGEGRRRLRTVVAAVLVAALVGLTWFARGALVRGGVGERPVLAVMGFRNADGSPGASYLSLLLALALDAELAAAESVRVVSAAEVARSKTELHLSEADHLDESTLGQLRANIGADLVILGSYSGGKPGKIRVRIQAQNTRSGRTVASVLDEGSESDLPSLFSRAGKELRRQLRLDRAHSTQTARTALPGSLEAMRLYSEGLGKLRAYDAMSAKGLLQRAIEAEPDYPQAHSALSQAWATLGYDQLAKEESERAFQLRTSLPRDQQLLIEGSYYNMAGEDAKAAAAYQELLRLAPDNPDYLLLLAGVQRSADAQRTVARLRALPPPLRDDPRIDLAVAEAADSANAYVDEQAAARRAAEKAKRIGAQLLAGDARVDEGWASWVLGQPDAAGSAYSEARQIFERVGNPYGAAKAIRGLALVAQYHGDLERARKLYEEAYGILRSTGSVRQAAIVMNGQAMVDSSEGRQSEALRHYRQSLALCEEARSPICRGTALNNIGYILFVKGDTAGARHNFDAALEAFVEGKGIFGRTFVLSSLGDLAEAEGKLDEAERELTEALELSQKLKDRASAASTKVSLAAVVLDRGKVREASQLCGDALREQLAIGQNDVAAKSRLVLARIALAAKQPASAESELRAALPTLERSKRRDDIALAHGLLSEAMAAQGRRDQALAEDFEARRQLGNAENRLVTMRVMAALAQAERLAGEVERSRISRGAAKRAATESGFRLPENTD